MDEPLVECSFPIPIVRDSAPRQHHQPHAWDDLTIELRKLVKSYPRGHQGPKTVFHWEEDVMHLWRDAGREPQVLDRVARREGGRPA